MKNKTILKSVFPMLFEEKRKRAAYILSCAAFTLTLFFFMPFDLYLNNYNDFNVSISNVLLPLATVSLIVFLITAVINPVLFREFKKIVLEMILLLMLGVALACYIQVLLFNSDMVNLNGNTANYGDITFKRTVNFVLWCLIVILPFVAHILLKKKKKCLFPIITGISIVMIGMQAVGLIPALSKYDGKSVGGECFFSYNKTLELSSKENICVFIVDRLDVKFMNEALDNFPELYEMLDGFTYYENNLSTDTNTFPAVTRMLTNEVYEYDDTFAEYWDKAWSNYGVIDELRDNGYGSTMLIDKVSTFGTEEQIFDKSDNMMNLRDSEIKINFLQLCKTLFNISFGKAVPYYFKESFLEADGVDVNTTFYKFDVESDESFAQPSVSYDTDRTFQANLKDIGLSVQNKNKMFTFIHFAGVHDSGEIGYYGRAKEALDILDDYFSQMKKLNIYDKSTIIIVADHGNPSYDIEYELTIFLEKEITSALLIKTKDARGEMKRDSVSELSHENFPASILEFAGLPHEKYGLSYFDIINGGLSPTRTIKINRWYTAGRIELASIYEVNGDANEFDNWEYLPIIPQSNNP